MKELLKSYISQFGTESLFDADALTDYLTEHKANDKQICQIVLMIKCGNIKEYIERNDGGLTSVELNSMIIGCMNGTGLSREVVKDYLYCILCALNIDCAFERVLLPVEENAVGRAYEKLQSNKDLHFVETSYIPYESIEKELNIADSFFKHKHEDLAFDVYLRLAKAGCPQAMYHVGIMYFDGLGTEKSAEKGFKWVCAAAENGDPRAKARLGDYYYQNDDIFKRNFQKAYELYSGAGVLTVDPKIKGKIVNILNQKKINFIVLIFGALLSVFMWVFLFSNSPSVNSGVGCIGWGIPLTIIPTLIYAFACYLYSFNKYNNLKVFITAMTIIWSIYPLILALN